MYAKVAAVLSTTMAGIALWAGVAGAHVTVSPASLPQGTNDAILTFRVPNESTSASVTGLRLQFPLEHPIVVVSPEAGSGWKVTVKTATLPKPITTDDGTFTSTVSEIDWSGGAIPIAQFGEFNVLAQGLPTGTDKLVFKAIQQYSDGTTVSWIQIPDSAAPNPAHPAPTLVLTAPGKVTSAAAAGPETTSASAAVGAAVSGGSNSVAVVALIVAGFAVILALLAVWLGRPRLITEEAPDDGDVTGPDAAD